MIPKSRILKAAPYKPGKPIAEVKREFGLKAVIKLASNENPYGPSPKVLAAIRQAAKDVNRYPDGSCFLLRQELGRRLKVGPDQLIFGNGSDEIIVCAIRALVEPGDRVIIAKPSFLVYEISATIEGAQIEAVNLKDFRYDLDGMAAVVTAKTKIIFIGNPDNPASTFVTEKQLETFLQKIPARVLVFLDEAYFDYVTSRDYPDSLKLLKNFPNLMVTRTFSKLYGLAGLRVGYGVAAPELIDILNRVREPFNVNSLAQEAALAALNDRPYYQELVRRNAVEKKFLYAGLKKLELGFVESATNFILVKAGEESKAICQRLLEQGVIVRDMSAWGLMDYFRVTIGNRRENQIFLSCLKQILAAGAGRAACCGCGSC